MSKKSFPIIIMIIFVFSNLINAHNPNNRKIVFPDIPGYQTLVCDFHQHTVFSDGHVWPSIRVQEAVKDGLDAISITDHLEYQPKKDDIPHPDRNRPYHVANEIAKNGNNNLIVVNGAEVTRDMPPGHSNAIFLNDVNKLLIDDAMDAFKEAKKQDAFVFWNHPNWTSQRPDGIARLTDMHRKLIKDGLLSGIEVVNDVTYSDEALQIALDHNLTIMGTSDIHGLVDWQYKIPDGGHRPVTLVFAKDKSEQSLKEGLVNRRTVVWHNNTLIGREEFLVPLIQESIAAKNVELKQKEDDEPQTVIPVEIKNISDVKFILVNKSEYTLHNDADLVTVEPHSLETIRVKTLKELSEMELKFEVLNGILAPKIHPEIVFKIKINRVKVN